MHGIDTETIIGYQKARREPRVGASMTAAARNVRPKIKVYPHKAPEQPRQGDTLARPARMPIAVFQAIAPILSVMQDSFGYLLFAPTHHAQTLQGPGDQLEWAERSNIIRYNSTPYGSLFALEATQEYRYPLLGVR